MKHPVLLVFGLLALVASVGCSSLEYRRNTVHDHNWSDGSLEQSYEHQFLFEAERIERKARAARREAAQAKRMARFIRMGKSRSQLSSSQKMRASRADRKARRKLMKARRYERQADTARRKVKSGTTLITH